MYDYSKCPLLLKSGTFPGLSKAAGGGVQENRTYHTVKHSILFYELVKIVATVHSSSKYC